MAKRIEEPSEVVIDTDLIKRTKLEYDRFTCERLPGFNKWDMFCVHKNWAKFDDYMGKNKLTAISPDYALWSKYKEHARKYLNIEFTNI